MTEIKMSGQMQTELMDCLADEQTRDSQKILTKAMELYRKKQIMKIGDNNWYI